MRACFEGKLERLLSTVVKGAKAWRPCVDRPSRCSVLIAHFGPQWLSLGQRHDCHLAQEHRLRDMFRHTGAIPCMLLAPLPSTTTGPLTMLEEKPGLSHPMR